MVSGNALTVKLNPCNLQFRAQTLASAGNNLRYISAQLTLTVPASATLGTVNATQSRIVVLAIDNAGTVELAVVNIAGGVDLSETSLISTTAISAGSTSASVIYSTTARTNVPYRVVGYVESTQATAGTWTTAPSTIQGTGGQALAAMSSLGYGQTWQNVTRAAATTFYNTTGRPITWMIQTGVSGVHTATVGNFTFGPVVCVSPNQANTAYLIPPGASYSYTLGGGSTTHYELR